MPRKIFVFAVVIFLCSFSRAQRSIEGLVNAEKNFAAYSLAHGTKEAFLKFADSTGIVFDPAVEDSINAIRFWAKRENRSGKLNWGPEFAEIAGSQNFGYTTGPYTFSRNDSVIARGEYVTVWHLDKNGEWKFLLDLGVNNTPGVSASELTKIKAEKFSGNATADDMIKAEQDFIASFAIDPKKAYNKYLSANSILKRNGHRSETNKTRQKKMIDADPVDDQFKMIGSGIASSGDLGYVYGKASVGVKQFGYQRIWRREKDGWKIALEVLRY